MTFRALAVLPLTVAGMSLALSASSAAHASPQDSPLGSPASRTASTPPAHGAAGHKTTGTPPRGKPTSGKANGANPANSATPANRALHKKGHKGPKRGPRKAEVATPHPTIAAALRNWGDYDVVEGQLAPPVTGAVCPSEMANVENRFCIDRWEGSLVEGMPDGHDVPWPPYGAIDESRTLRAVSVPGVYPQAYISGAQAERACEGGGKRLCAPVEWRKACMGPSQSTFGYGNERAPGRCNDAGSSPMLRIFPQVSISWTLVGMTEMNDPRLNQLEQTLAPTGSHDTCTNDYGVFDMVGNLHEWTNDPNGTFQGGYYLDTHKNGDGCTYRTVAHEFTYHDYSTGFRCCAPPASP